MRKIKLIIAYDGTKYSGWQIQTNALSIQECLEKALSIVLRQPVLLIGSSRTDAGVHALGQTAHFTTLSTLDGKRLVLSVNALLPLDIRVVAAYDVAADFHARYDAKAKIYHYRLHLGGTRDPFKALCSYHIPYPLDLGLLQSATKYFIGTHDFTAFTNQAHQGPASKNGVRTLYRLSLLEEEGGVRLEFEGDGFLYKMVRNIVGTLIEVARGKIEKDQVPNILHSFDRRQAAMTAPPHGLCLKDVLYRDRLP